MDFRIDATELIDYTLTLQKINDVALPIAVQQALNDVARDVKKRTLIESTNKEFDIKKRTFFSSNSGYKPYNAKQFGYNLNKLKSEVGITKGTRPNEKATEQVGHQETASPIKRSENPLGNKPQSKNVIGILSKKPEFVHYDSNDEQTPFKYIRAASRAKKRGSALIILKSDKTGAVHQVRQFKKRKPTKKNPNKSIIKLKNIASYHKGGELKLKKRHPFLTNAVMKSGKEVMNDSYIKAAERQVNRIRKK